jgi:ADP-heptose:LPS heptosyltransferase
MFKKARVGLYLRFARPSLRRRSIPFTDVLRSAEQILIRPPAGPGELLFSLPALAAIRRNYPNSELSLLIPESRMELADAAGLADRVIPYSEPLVPFTASFKTLSKGLKRTQFDLYLDLNRPEDDTRKLFASIGGAKIRIGTSRDEEFPYLNYEVRPGEKSRDEVSRSLSLLSWMDERSREKTGPAEHHISVAEKLWVDEFLISHSSIHTEKRIMVDLSLPRRRRGWGLDGLIQVFRGLEQLCNPRLFVVPSSDAEPDGSPEHLGVKRQIVFVNEPILRTASLMRRCDLVISSRSDLFSLAYVSSVPTILLLNEQEDFQPPVSDTLRVFRIRRGAVLPSAEIVGAAAALLEMKSAQ